MAVGDMVSGFSATSTVLNFQPAVGVSVMITSIGGVTVWSLLTDGTITTGYTTQTESGGKQANVKIFINNSLYLRIDSTSYNNTYTGIQIQ